MFLLVLCSFRMYHDCFLSLFMCRKGDPTEECVRCNKVYLASTAELKQGLCQKCLENPLPSDDQENEEVDVTISSRHKKFANKFLNKLNADLTPSNSDEELSNDSSSEQIEIA